MIFTRLSLKNFKSYDEAEIKFNEGISVIVGENGAGKSTILEAISFALFKQHTAKKIDDLIRNGSDDGMYVELDFISNGKEYRVVRDKKSAQLKSTFLKKTSSNSSFIPVCAGDKEVTNEIRSVLDIDSDLFLNAIYIRQGEIAELVDKTAAEKKQLIGKLLGIDSLEKAWKNLQPFISSYENKKSELKGRLASADETYEEREKKISLLNTLKERGLELEKEVAEVTELKEEIANDKLNMEREKEIYDNFCHNLEVEQEALASLEKDKSILHDRLDEIKEAEEKMLRLEKFTKKLPLYLDFEKSVTSIQQLKVKEDEINSNLESIQEQKAIVEAEQEGYSNYMACEEELEKLKDRKSKIEQELVGITQLEENKRELLKVIEENRNDINSFFSTTKDELYDNGLSQDILADVDKFSQLEEVTNNFLEEISDKIESINKEINEKKEENVKFKEAMKAADKPLNELDEVDNQCPLCQSEITSAKKVELKKYYSDIISENRSLIYNNDENIHLLKKNRDNFAQKEENVKEISKNIIEYKHKFAQLEKDLGKLNRIDEGLESKDYINSKLGEIILSISREEVKHEEYQASYEKYNKAKGALDVLDSETETQYNLNQVQNEIDTHIRNIEIAIEQDSHLSNDITTQELQNRINDLKQKEEEYNQLKGFVKNKKSLEGQLTSKKEDIDWKYNKIDNIKSNIENSKYDREKYDKLIYSSEVFEKRYERFSEELNGIKGQSKEVIEQVKSLTTKVLEDNRAKEELDGVNKYLIILNSIRELYGKNGIQKDLRNYSKPVIQKYTKDFFNQFNFNYSDLILDDNYDVSVFGPEGETSLNMVSGGEKIAIALALRLGITQAMSKGDLETILLDEPTIYLDSFRKHELINLLKEMSMLPQMIIVTHETQLENAATNLIKVEKNNGISKVIIEN
ncbi:AAA family ATPase [Methanobrevibacter woesei]|uniref:AAA family ATPase n=1 Tax=Methanobrevibacter woesei TaxID=190976 RepID=UPI00255C02A2|nr:SMC family ATPase [Methanobrevibacter woesei]